MYIDFSCKRDIYLQDEFGDIQSMAEPYFRKEQIAPGTWLIRSDGDFSYLVEGESEAVLIDSGYGCGNIRAGVIPGSWNTPVTLPNAARCPDKPVCRKWQKKMSGSCCPSGFRCR